MVICLERGADLHMDQRIPLPLTVSCFSKIQIGFTFLVPAHPGSPGQRAVKRVCVCVCVCVIYYNIRHTFVPYSETLTQNAPIQHADRRRCGLSAGCDFVQTGDRSVDSPCGCSTADGHHLSRCHHHSSTPGQSRHSSVLYTRVNNGVDGSWVSGSNGSVFGWVIWVMGRCTFTHDPPAYLPEACS